MQITDKNFEDEVVKFNGTVLVDFFAEWCGPCKLLGPIIKELAKYYEKDVNIKIVKMNIDENPETAQKYNVVSIPTMIIFKSGEKKNELMGVQSKEALTEVVDNISK